MDEELGRLKTAAEVARHYKIWGHAMCYGQTILAVSRCWNDERGAYDLWAAIFDRLIEGQKDKNTPVCLVAESDETFPDQGHAFAWAISMVQAR